MDLALRVTAALTTACVVFAVYIDTLFLSIPGGDSGELVAEACKLGHAHPPGYPLFILLYHYGMKVFDWPLVAEQIGEKEAAWRSNAISATLASIGAFFFCLSLGKITRVTIGDRVIDLSCSVCFTLLYSFSPLVWLYSIGAEVFALNNCMVSVLVFLSVSYMLSTSNRERLVCICCGAFWSGFSLCNQHTIILYEVPLIGWILYLEFKAKNITTAKFISWSVLFFVGLTPYLYLPVALKYNRQQGSWGDTTTLYGFIHHLRRGDYGTFRLYASDQQTLGLFGRLRLYFHDATTRQGLYVVSLFAICGLVQLASFRNPPAVPKHQYRSKKTSKKKGRKKHSAPPQEAMVVDKEEATTVEGNMVLLVLFMTYCFYLFVFHFLSNLPLDEPLLFGVQARFWMQPNLLLFVLAAYGFGSLCKKIASIHLGRVIAVGVGVALSFLQYSQNYYMSDQKENKYLEMYARAILAPVPQHSVLVVGYDQQWTSLRYLQQCLGVRPDVTILNGPMMTYSWAGSYTDVYHKDPRKCIRFPSPGYWVHAGSEEHINGKGYTTLDFVRSNMASCEGGVLWTGKLPHPTDTEYNKTYATYNMGLVTKFVEFTKEVGKDEQLNPGIFQIGFEQWFKLALRSWSRVDKQLNSFPNTTKYTAETWEYTITLDFFDHICSDASEILSFGIEHADLNLIAFGAFLFERAYLMNSKHMSAANVKNLGLAFVKLVQTKGGTFQDSKFYKNTDHVKALFGEKLLKWREESALRGFKYWSIFLKMDKAKMDAGYETIKGVVAHLQKTHDSIST